MSIAVFLVVLAAAALHATWNAVVKRGADTLLTTIGVAGVAAILSALALPFLPPIEPAAWPFLAASAGLEIIYYVLIAAAYRHADMSRTYPLMRGLPPLLVSVVSTSFLGVVLAPAAWLGVGCICAGILTLTFATQGKADNRGMAFALLNAGIIASYTLVDSFGVRASGHAVTYTAWIFLLTGAPLVVWAAMRRSAALGYARSNWLALVIGGLGTLISYGLVLWAMTEAPVAMVAALRETSILFGTAIAVVILKERLSVVRGIAVLIIAAGAILLRLA